MDKKYDLIGKDGPLEDTVIRQCDFGLLRDVLSFFLSVCVCVCVYKVGSCQGSHHEVHFPLIWPPTKIIS